jgi:hypothetical protein
MPRLTNKLTNKQEVFLRALATGMTQESSYAKAYPRSAKWKRESREKRASLLLSMAHVREAYLAIIEECREKENEWVKWTREDHIKTLVQSIREIEDEIDRRKVAMQAEVQLLMKLAEQQTESRIEYELAAQRALQRPLVNAATTKGLVSAAESLSRLLGLTHTQVGDGLTLSFVGEDAL